MTAPPLPDPVPLADPKRASPLLGIALGAVAGALLGTVIAKYGLTSLPKLGLPGWQKVALVLTVLAAMPLVTLVHELGHVVAGLLAGLEFNMLLWGPFKLTREGGRLHLARNRSLALAGGLALCVPRNVGSGNGAAAAMVAGGPVVSLLVGVALLGLARTMSGGTLTSFGDALALVLAGGGGLASLAVGLVTLVPARTSGFLTDGARLLRLARGGRTADRDRAMMTLVGLAASPTRPRHWPTALVHALDAVQDGTPLDAAAPLLAYLHALDRGEQETALAALLRLVERLHLLPPTARGSYATELAFHELAVRGDRERARAWLALTKDSPFADRLLQPLLGELVQATASDDAARARVQPLLAELAERSGVDRMRAEWLARAV